MKVPTSLAHEKLQQGVKARSPLRAPSRFGTVPVRASAWFIDTPATLLMYRRVSVICAIAFTLGSATCTMWGLAVDVLIWAVLLEGQTVKGSVEKSTIWAALFSRLKQMCAPK